MLLLAKEADTLFTLFKFLLRVYNKQFKERCHCAKFLFQQNGVTNNILISILFIKLRKKKKKKEQMKQFQESEESESVEKTQRRERGWGKPHNRDS